MNRLLALLALTVPLLWSCDGRSATGTNDETTTSLAVIYRLDGKPAAGARVMVYAPGDTQSTPRAQGIVDDEGHVSLPQRLPAGSWNLMVRDAGGTALFQDSLPSDGSKLTILTDTLRRIGKVVGRVRVQPQDKPTIAWVQLLGAGRYANVDDSGRFAFDSVPSGRLALLARTLVAQYTPTFRALRLLPDSTLDLGFVDLVYTGVPMVTGVKASWDSTSSVVTVTWDSVPRPDILGYHVYRSRTSDPLNVMDMAFLPAGRRWSDTLFRGFRYGGSLGGQYDTLQTPLFYRVMAVTNNGSGPMSFADSVGVRSPVMTGAWNPGWSSLGQLPSGHLFGSLDSLGNGLACLASPAGGSSTAMWTSADGRAWSKAFPLDTATLSSCFWNGSFYWITGHSDGRSVNINPYHAMSYSPDTVRPVFDTLRLHRFDGTVTSLVNIPVHDTLTSAALLQPLGGRMLLLEAGTVISAATSMPYTSYGHVRATEDGAAWRDGSSDSAILLPLQQSQYGAMMMGPYWGFAAAKDGFVLSMRWITSLDTMNVWKVSGPTFPSANEIPAGSGTPFMGMITPYASSLFFTAYTGGLRWAPQERPAEWHMVASPGGAINALLPWRGCLLAADETVLRTSSAIPSSF